MKQIFFNLIFNFTESGNVMIQSLFSPFMSGFSITGFIMQLAAILIDKLSFIFYFIAKFFLAIVDLIFSYVQRLCGLTMDYKSLSGMFSAESDVVFNLLITSKDTVVPIIQNMLGLVIFMIILFTIIALIKAQFNSLTSKKPGFIMEVLKKTMRAFVLLMVTPMIALGAIAGSNLLLMTLHRATNSAGGASLGTQIFSASAATANNYRMYAETAQRIPITFDFSKQKEVLEYYKNKPATDKFAAYLKGSGNLIYTTYTMFQLEEFQTYSAIEKDEQSKNNYYLTYDVNTNPGRGAYASYKKIESNPEQYYVMADVVDFAINTGNRLRIMTIEQVLDSIIKIVDETERKTALANVVNRYNITILGSSDTKVLASYGAYSTEQIYKAYTEQGKKGIRYIGSYISDQGRYVQLNHTHVCGSTDEVDGAKFVVAAEMYDSNNTLYYEPISIGYSKNFNTSFYSDYLQNGSMVTAKGFMDNQYPTALKINSTNQLVSYREDFVNSVSGDVSKLAGFTIGTAGPQGPLAGLIAMIQMFFNPMDSVDSTIAIDPGPVQLSYDSNPIECTKIADGKFQLGYFMRYSNKNTTDITVLTLYRSSEFNIFLMFAAPIVLIKVMFVCFLGLIQRSYELFLIIIFYPAAVVAIPLDDAGYTNWMKMFTNKLFAAYGMILGINFVLMLFPIISQMEYFTQADIATNKVAFKVCSLFFGGTIRQMTTMLNIVTGILFQLVAFTLLDIKPDNGGVPDMINKMAGTDGDLSSDLAENFAAAVKSIKKFIKIVGEIGKLVLKAIPHTSSQTNSADTVDKTQKAAQNTRKIKDFMNKLLPGGKIREKIAEKKALGKDKDKVDKKRKELEEKLKKEKEEQDEPQKPGEDASEEDKKAYEQKQKEYEEAQQAEAKEIESQFQALIASEREYTESLKDPSTNREAKAEEEIQNNKMGVTDEDYQDDGDEGDGEDDEEVSNRDGDGEGDDGGGDGEGGDDKPPPDEAFKTDAELNSREKELKKNIERLENLSTGDLKSKSLTDHEKAMQRALKRQKAELARIQKEKQNRKDNGLENNSKNMTERANEYNELMEKDADSLTPEEKKRIKDLQNFMIRNSKKDREQALQKNQLERDKAKEEREKKKQRESERINRDYEDRKLFLNKDAGLIAKHNMKKRLKEATNQNNEVKEELLKLMQKKGMSDDETNKLLEQIAQLRLNDETSKAANGQTQKFKSQDAEFDKMLEMAGITDTKLLKKFEELRKSQSDMQHLEQLVERRENSQEKWMEEKAQKYNEEHQKAASRLKDVDKVGRLGRIMQIDKIYKLNNAVQMANMTRKVNSHSYSDLQIGKVDLKIEELQAQLELDQNNLVLKNKLNNLKLKRAKMATANERVNTWEEQKNNSDTIKQLQDEYKSKKDLEDAKKKAMKTLKGSGRDYDQADIDRMTEYYINPEAAKKRIKEMKKLDKYGQKNMIMSKGDKYNVKKIVARNRATDKAEKQYEKTLQELNARVAEGDFYNLLKGKDGAQGKTIDQVSDAEINAYIRNMKKGQQYYTAEQLDKIGLLERYMEQRKFVPTLQTFGADNYEKRKADEKAEKEYIKENLAEKMKNDERKYPFK